jgi:membrane protein implicated in regulation of membrane protease activity
MRIPAGVRNVLIIALLALAVAFVPGGGKTSSVIVQIISFAFLAVISVWAFRLYREHRVELYSLGDRNRAILYGSAGVALLTVTGTPRLWNTGPGVVVWFVLIGAASFGVYSVYRAWRSY